MSTNIPFDIQEEIIIKVVSVKSLIRLRSVSKQWKSLIDSSEFIAHHHCVNKNHAAHHLLLRYPLDSAISYVSIVDDDSFPQHKVSHTVHVSPTLELFSNTKILNSSHGLVCLYGFDGDEENRKNLIVVWNPSIKKSVSMPLQDGVHVFGFGVCPKTSDPKIVKITHTTTTDLKAEVYGLKERAWKTVSMNLSQPLNSITYCTKQVVIDGIIYWADYKLTDEHSYCRHRIVSFDLTNEEFGEVEIGDKLGHVTMVVCKVKESLALLKYDHYSWGCDICVIIKNGNTESSLAKLFRLDTYDGLSSYKIIIGFRKNGQLIRQSIERITPPLVTTLEVYDPCTQRSNDLGFYADSLELFSQTITYTESLLLLNHSDSIIHG